MPHLLQNTDVGVLIDLPHEGYQSARFDWTGKITTVTFRGIPMTTIERTDGQDTATIGKGFYNEFGIDAALGFEACKPGEWFHKIGVGLLQKDDGPYRFHHAYPIKPAEFKTHASSDHLIINCTGAPHQGFAYFLQKKIELNEDGFTIRYHLENTGENTIETDEYVHNFLAINHALIDHQYRLSFPFPLHPAHGGETVNPEEKVVLKGHDLSFRPEASPPEEPFFFSQLGGVNAVKASWELTHNSQGIFMRETASFPCHKANVWGWKHVISPELFCPLSLQAGESYDWSRQYSFANVHPRP